jgi:hypothetical protein
MESGLNKRLQSVNMTHVRVYTVKLHVINIVPYIGTVGTGNRNYEEELNRRVATSVFINLCSHNSAIYYLLMSSEDLGLPYERCALSSVPFLLLYVFKFSSLKSVCLPTTPS